MKSQFEGIYIGSGRRDRVGREGVNYGMTGIFTNQPSMFPVAKPNGPLWSFVPHGTYGRFTVFVEDIYDPEAFVGA